MPTARKHDLTFAAVVGVPANNQQLGASHHPYARLSFAAVVSILTNNHPPLINYSIFGYANCKKA